MAVTVTWDATYLTIPAGTENKNLGDNRIREHKEAITERQQVDHYWDLAGDQDDHGKHVRISFNTLHGSNPIDAGDAGIYPDSGGEVHVVDSSGNDMQLTNGGVITGSPLTTKGDIYARDTAPNRYPVSGTDGFILTENAALPFGFGWTDPKDVAGNFANVFHVQEQLAQGTDAGGYTQPNWTKRALNTTLQNNITGASIASNQVTLPAGNYFVIASAPANKMQENRLRLETTGAVTVLTGNSAYSTDAGNNNIQAWLYGYFTLASSTALELQHRGNRSQGADGLGFACGFGGAEIYANFMVWKLS